MRHEVLHVPSRFRSAVQPALRPPPRKSKPLSLTQLEPRDNPATPVGLLDVPSFGILWLGGSYAENHAVTRGEASSMTVDQAGTGSSGTFTIDFVGSAHSGDTADANGTAPNISMTGSGSGSGEFSYHLVISGEYDDGVFTITSETYTETGSESITTNLTWTQTDGTGTYTTQTDATVSASHSLSWSATGDGSGGLTYTSYSYSLTLATYWHEHRSYPGGGYTDLVVDAGTSVTTTGSGTMADYTVINSRDEYHDEYGQTRETHYTDTVTGTAPLGLLHDAVFPAWQAGSPDATNFTYHGESSESASLTEDATYHNAGFFGLQLDVNSFDSSYYRSGSDHVVYDEPGIFESGMGTELFHRDETFTATVEATGSGAYVGGSADADYHAAETGDYSVANTYTVSDDESSGYDASGDPFEMVFNFSGISTGGGTVTATHDYHDSGDGLELTGESFAMSASSGVDYYSWGVRNGQAFDETTVIPGSVQESVSFPGESGPVAIPDGMHEAFPLKGMVNPNQVVFTSMQLPQLPTTPVRGMPGSLQNRYNQEVIKIGKAAEKKVTDQVITRVILNAINDNNPGNPWPRGSGSVTLGVTPMNPKGPGHTYAQALGLDDKITKNEAQTLALKRKFWGSAEVSATVVKFSYIIDGASVNGGNGPRSGNVVVTYEFITTYSGTLNGQPISQSLITETGGFLMHDASLERKKLQP